MISGETTKVAGVDHGCRFLGPDKRVDEQLAGVGLHEQASHKMTVTFVTEEVPGPVCYLASHNVQLKLDKHY